MNKQRLKDLSGLTRPQQDGDPGHTCPHCGKQRRGGTCKDCPHRGRCQHHRLKVAAETKANEHPHPDQQPDNDRPSDTAQPPELQARAEADEPPADSGGNGHSGPNGHPIIDFPHAPGPSCSGPHCVNLTVLRELSRLNRGLAQLRRQEKSLLRYLAQVDHETVQEFVLSLLLEPLFESIEQAYGAADVLRHHAAQDTTPDSPCPIGALINGLEKRLTLYLRMDRGLDEEAGKQMADLFDEKDISSAQIIESLSMDQAEGQLSVLN